MLYNALLGFMSVNPLFNSKYMNYMDLIIYALLYSYIIKPIKTTKPFKIHF